LIILSRREGGIAGWMEEAIVSKSDSCNASTYTYRKKNEGFYSQFHRQNSSPPPLIACLSKPVEERLGQPFPPAALVERVLASEDLGEARDLKRHGQLRDEHLAHNTTTEAAEIRWGRLTSPLWSRQAFRPSSTD